MQTAKLSPTLEALRLLPHDLREAALADLTDEEAAELEHDADFWLRPEQHFRPGLTRYTLALCGRFWGKSTGGSNAIRFLAAHPDLVDGRIGMAGRTAHETNLDMVREGVLAWSAPQERPRWWRSDKLLEWPKGAPWHGCTCRLFSGEVAAGFRGPNMGAMWLDELPHWQSPSESFETLDRMVRSGPAPWILITTTPLAVPVIVELAAEVDEQGTPRTDEAGNWIRRPDVTLVEGSSYSNLANAPENYVASLRRLEGTELGMQEIHGKILMGVPSALWRLPWIGRVESAPDCWRIVVAVDPAVSSGPDSAETGIVVAGTDGTRFYVFEDASGRYTPDQWASKVLDLVEKWGAWGVVCEDNQGGDLVETPLRMVAQRDRASARKWTTLRIERVRATKSKAGRAALVCGHWELRKVDHVGDPRRFVALEHQMTHFDPSKPESGQRTDRMDALVWAMLYLAGDGTDKVDGHAMLRGMQGVIRSMRANRRR